jgi:hypothetical protein
MATAAADHERQEEELSMTQRLTLLSNASVASLP